MAARTADPRGARAARAPSRRARPRTRDRLPPHRVVVLPGLARLPRRRARAERARDLRLVRAQRSDRAIPPPAARRRPGRAAARLLARRARDPIPPGCAGDL